MSVCESRLYNEACLIQSSLDQLNTWATRNDMILNSEKCILMTFSFMRNCPPPHNILLAGKSLKYTESACILGLWLSSNLRWEKHVDVITKKASSRLFWLKRLKNSGLPVQDLCDFYQGYIRPTLEYAAPVWHSNITTQQVLKIERIQKRALRIIIGSQYVCDNSALDKLDMPSSRKEEKPLA